MLPNSVRLEGAIMQKLFPACFTLWTPRFVVSYQMMSKVEDGVEFFSTNVAHLVFGASVVTGDVAG